MSDATVQSTARFNIIDFHNHHVPTQFELTAAKAAPANQRARWEAMRAGSRMKTCY
jgi:hypothetical protein